MSSRRSNQVHNLKRYGLSEDDYDAMLEAQEHGCAICGEQENKQREDGTEQPLSVDHCHVSGSVRGLLCHRCNTALGLFRDDTDLLKKAAEYLRLFSRRP